MVRTGVLHQMISFSELTQPTEKSGGESPSNSSLSRWFTWLGIGRFLIPGGWICARRAVSLTGQWTDVPLLWPCVWGHLCGALPGEQCTVGEVWWTV